MEKYGQQLYRMTDGTQSSQGQSQKVFRLPGDVKLSFEALTIPSNEKNNQQTAKSVVKIFQPQRHLSSDSTNEQTESSEFVIKQSANSTSSTSLSDTFPLSTKDTMQNVFQQKVSVVNSDSHFLQYELVSSIEQTPIDYSKNKIYLEGVLEDHLSQRQCKLEEDDAIKSALETVKAYCNSMVEVEQIMKTFQNQNELVSDQIVTEFKTNLNLRRTQLALNQQKFYMYSVFVIDQSRIYCELLKGVSVNLLGLLEFSAGSFAEQLLRLGNTNLFDSQSSTTLTLSRMQQFVNAMQFNNFGVSDNENLIFVKADGKQHISVSASSSIVPLSSQVIPNGRTFIYAFMHITEVFLDKNISNNFSNHAPHISSSSTTLIYPQMQSYLQSCNKLLQKYYSLGSQRKKRYRKTKLQVEQELKFYLSKNHSNLN